jgi:hypothetical protein
LSNAGQSAVRIRFSDLDFLINPDEAETSAFGLQELFPKLAPEWNTHLSLNQPKMWLETKLIK